MKSSKGLKVVLNGIEPKITPIEIPQALNDKGFNAKTVFNILTKVRQSQPLFNVNVEPKT